MKLNKRLFIAVIGLFLVTIGLTACGTGKSTAQDLQSRSWTFSDTSGDGGTLQFQKNVLFLQI